MDHPLSSSHRLPRGKISDFTIMLISHIDEEREGILIYADGIEEGPVFIYDLASLDTIVLIILFYLVE